MTNAGGFLRSHDRQKRRWLIEFGVVTLVPIVVLGLVVAASLRGSIRDRALDRAKQEAVTVGKLAIEPQLSSADLERGVPVEKRNRIGTALSEGSLGRRIVQVSVRSPAGRVVYSTSPRTIGRLAPPSLQAKVALDGYVSSGAQPDGEGGRIVATTLPVRLPDQA